MFLGSREDTAHLGYVQGVCPKCRKPGAFSVYLSKRKMTISMLASVPMGEQHILECRHCQTRFAIPPEMKADLEQRLITADKMADFVERLPVSAGAGPAGPPARTLYQVLQLDPEADPEVVEAAFKRLAFKHHPDRSKDPDSPARMREILSAKDILGDPQKRRAYDRSIGIVREAPKPRATRPEDV